MKRGKGKGKKKKKKLRVLNGMGMKDSVTRVPRGGEWDGGGVAVRMVEDVAAATVPSDYHLLQRSCGGFNKHDAV